MFEGPEFYGSTTVGERGQIVLPANLRKKFKICAGDKLIVVGIPGIQDDRSGQIMLVRAELLNKMLKMMAKHQKVIMDAMANTGEKERDNQKQGKPW